MPSVRDLARHCSVRSICKGRDGLHQPPILLEDNWQLLVPVSMEGEGEMLSVSISKSWHSSHSSLQSTINTFLRLKPAI